MNRVLRATALSLAALLMLVGCDKDEGGGIVPPPTSVPTVVVEAESPALPIGGATTGVVATLVDGKGAPIIGASVEFTTSLGAITSSVNTNAYGEARAILTSGDAPGTAQVAVRCLGSLEGATAVLFIEQTPGLTLTAGAGAILADGVASTLISAIVRDAFGNAIAPGTPVQFTTSLGVLTDLRPTDADGKATARLRADRHVTGTARITGQAVGYQDILDVGFVSEAASNVVLVSVERATIGVRASGDNETSTLVFEARDRNGIPVDEAHSVWLGFGLQPEGGATDATVHPTSAPTNERGQVAATVNAGMVSGAVMVTAATTGIESRPVRVAIHGGLPDLAHFSIALTQVNIAGLVYDDEQTEIVAHVGDRYGNPVPTGTMIWFTSDFGITYGSAGTDSLGRARVLHYSAAPRPPDGWVPIRAQTVDQWRNPITVDTRVLWSDDTIVEITSPASGFSGSNVEIQYRVRDAHGHPLTPGTTITVETTRGEIFGDVDVTLPDTQNPEYTYFRAYLSRGAADAGAVRVTVTVTSRNGNRAAWITGTLQ